MVSKEGYMKEEIIKPSIIERNYIDLCVKVASLFNSKVMKTSYYSWAQNPLNDWFNRVFNLNITPENINEVLAELVKNMENGSIPKYIVTGSTSKPANIDKYLLENNFIPCYEQTGMAIYLDKIAELSNNECELKVIESEADLFKWVDAVNEAFNINDDPELYLKLLYDDDITFYAGYVSGKIVATTMLFNSSDTAGIHQVGTLREYRGKGFGTALTQKAFYDAKLKGCRFGVLQASEMGKRVYSKVGLTEYCIVRHWEYKNPFLFRCTKEWA